MALDPEHLLVGWGDFIRRDQAISGGASFYVPDFFLKTEAPWVIPMDAAIVKVSEFSEFLKSQTQTRPSLSWNGPDEALFRSSFLELQRHFAMGELKKAVPVVFEQARWSPTPAELASILSSLVDQGRGVRLYGLWNGSEGIVGGTPEDLFVKSGGGVHTMALAGTRKREEGAVEALFSDQKERHEHQWVIDDIRERLTPFGAVSVGATGVVELPSLVHLKTPIDLKAEDVAFQDLVKALHPTAALGAYPREAGWRWLEAQPGAAERGRFGAPFGVALDKDFICAVAIRNIQWSGGNTRLGSGCGVISESDPESEWAELALKRLSVKRLMGLANE